MGDALATVREKAQAHQEESKAKRFRDRGGLFQPLSPSKNMLLRILNSAEFRNISEGAAIEIPPTKEPGPFQPETPQIQRLGIVDSAKPTTKAKRKAPAIENRDDLSPKLQKPTKDPVKQGKSRSKGKTTAVVDVSIGLDSEDEVLPLSGRKSSRTNGNGARLKKSSITKESRRKAMIAPAGEDLLEELSIRDPATRSRRATRKRNVREHFSDNEGDESERPSPAKKPRARPSTKTKPSVTIRESTRQAASAIDEPRRAVLGFAVLEKKGKTRRLATGPGGKFDPKAVGTSQRSPSTRRRKRTETPSDDEQPSSPKRRCTATNSPPGHRSKTANVGDEALFEIVSPDSVEFLKPVRKPKREAPVNTNGTKAIGTSSGEAGNLGIDASLRGSRTGETVTFCHGGLSTIIEDGEIPEGNGEKDEMRLKEFAKITRHSSKPILPGSREAQTANNNKDSPEAEGGTFIHPQAPTILEKHRKNGVELAAEMVGGGVDKKNSRAGMTKRRRKKVSPAGEAMDAVGVHLSPTKAATTQDIERLRSQPIIEVVETAKPQRPRRTNGRQKVSLDTEIPLPSSPSPSRQHSKLPSIDRHSAEAPFNGLTIKKTSRTKVKTKGRPRLAEPQTDLAPNDSSHGKENFERYKQSPPKQERAARRKNPPPPRDTHFDNALESDIDELDLLS